MNGDETNNELEGLGSAPESQRSASVTFRAPQKTEGIESQMDEANKSLAEALRFSYWLLGVAMAILLVLYVLSGFQTISESERGIRVRFGVITGDNLPPGFRPAWPFPFGEMVKVSAGVESVELREEFWPALSEADKMKDPTQLVGGGALSPERDGFLITSDSAIAHAQWLVRYSKAQDPRAFAENIHPDAERDMVRLAVSRGVIHALAGKTIQQLLESGDAGDIARIAQESAQRVLEEIDSGIVIEELTLSQKMAPLELKSAFAEVVSAESTRNQRIQEAIGQRDSLLNRVAGRAAPYIVREIERYEEAIMLEDAEGERQAWDRIGKLLSGDPVEIEGRVVEAAASGEASNLITDAESYRSYTVQERRTEASTFAGKQGLFRTSSKVLVQQEWDRAMREFLDQQFVQPTFVPAGTKRLELLLNEDPEYFQQYQQFRKEELNRLAAERRERDRQQQDLKVDTESLIMDTGPGG